MKCAECGLRVRPSQHHPITACLKRLQKENAKLRATIELEREIMKQRTAHAKGADR